MFQIKLMSLMLDEEVALGNDSRYKSFIGMIERVLKQFEYSTEWADLITYLVRIKKTIENYAQFPFIPKRITLLKRLAQCLHPALPAGVHLKALEVYETIFRIIDKRQLQRDIILYSYGLFPLLPIAALPVKPVLLRLYELYFLPLGEALNPVLTGFLMGLFSTLEEGADYHQRVIAILDNLANQIDEFYFYTCIWSAIHLVASVRYSAITFIINHFDRRKNIEDQFHLIGLSTETMVSAVCTCLYDNEQSLAQRSALDFLLTCLPIHKKQLSKINLMKIMTVILHIFLKRDMSLNKRIYTWFFGTYDLCKDVNNQQHQTDDPVDPSAYFITYTREILIESLRNSLDTISRNVVLINVKSTEDDHKAMTNIINSLPSPWTLTKLIRVLLVLVDKSDVGPNIIESIFMNYLLLVYEQVYQPAKKSTSVNIEQENNYSEILKTFHMLLDTLEPYFIWEFLTKNFDIVLNQQSDKELITAGATMEQISGIINMLLDISSLDSSTQIQTEHLPKMLYRLIKIMNNNIEKLTPHHITLCIEILLKIFKNIIPPDTNHHLSMFYRSISHQGQIFDNNLTDSDTEDDNEYSILHTHKSPNPTLITEQPDLDDIERLLHQMVRKVEKQVYHFSDKKQTRLSIKTRPESINHIEKAIKLYKIFFHRFILTYLIDRNQILLNDKFYRIYAIIEHQTNDSLLTIFNRYQQLNEFQLKLNDNIDQYKTPFEDCCKLLIEFCCFPKQSSTNDQSISSKGKIDFDDWFIDLCVLSLCHTGHFSVQTIAISVLIELFDYTLKIKKSADVVTDNLSLFLNETDFFQYLIAYLWEYLSEKYNREYNLKASYTLLILHSMLPSNLCEDLICHQLSLIKNQQSQTEINRIEAFQRFFKLWNSTRDISNITKSFPRCLISILSILRESSHDCLKEMVEQWTYDCFVHGDMCRIFDVLLMMLLHPDTTRISMQQFDSVADQEYFLESKDQILINSSSNNDTHEMNEITFSLSFDEENYDDKSIQENESEREEIGDGKRSRAGSYANPNETVPHAKSLPQTIKAPSISNLSQPILSNFLSFSPPMITRSIKQRAPTMPTVFSRQKTPSESNINHSLRSYSVPTDTIINDPIDFQDAYTLLYTQSYDYNRVTLSLNIIQSLIDLIPQQLVHTLLITSNIQSASISIYNNPMHELFFKHRQVFDLSNENNQEYQSYLYILLNTLLIYTYSYYYSKGDHISENYQIHIHALILLTRICHDLSHTCMENGILINYIINLLKKLSFQKIILCLFHRLMNKKTDLFKLNTNVHHQLTKQYFKQFMKLLEEMILLENVISSTDLDLIHQPIVNQTIFLPTILQYLKQIQWIESHHYIISLVVRILPHCGSALKTISIRVIEQMCRNLCFVVQYYCHQNTNMKFKQLSSFDAIDYIIHLIQRLSDICNYCLGNTTNNTQHFTQTLCPQHWMKRITINANDLSDARQLILNKLSSILSSLLFVWKTLSIDQIHSLWLLNNIKQIRETIIEFISSVTKSNSVAFVRAVAKCWGERRRQGKSSGTSKDNNDEIQALINILMSINNYTINDMVYNMNELIRNQTMINEKKKQNYIMWCVQFLLAYLEQQKNVSIDCWSTLAIMLKECLAQSTAPSVTFLIIKILSFYIKQSNPVEKRDLQDVTMKVLEHCNTIVASSLEQTNWLRRNLQVRLAQLDLETTTGSSNEIDHVPDTENNTLRLNDKSQSINSSLMALTILAEHAAKLLDAVYNLTDEKDRFVVPFLQNLVSNVMPYVRTHVLSNAPSYRSASVLLMNISQYPYTKKTWKKEVFELLFDTSFFQVDLLALRSWKVIIDNLLKNEKPISFRDLMSKINTVQTGLFVSKEQEYEQRAMLIKRFAFVIYASEKDYYNRHLPEILGCISDLLKLPQIPILYTQIFLFLRVLLIRISNKSLISFWPTLISELIQVLLQLEQDLLNEIKGDTKSNIQRMTMNEIISTNISNASLKMYLYACKLLDILLAMPYSEIDYFQFFRSAFVADHGTTNPNSTGDLFITFSIRLAKLLEQKLQSISTSPRYHLPVIKTSNCPLLRLRAISNIIELFPFFNSLACYDHTNEQILVSDKLNDIETSVLEDFVESWI